LDEFTFQFNRRTPPWEAVLALVQQSVAVATALYASLVKRVQSGKRRKLRHNIWARPNQA
jgi:hypothetical protein